MSLDIPPPRLDCEDRVKGALSILLSLIPSTQRPLKNASQMNVWLAGAPGQVCGLAKRETKFRFLLLLHLLLMKYSSPTGRTNEPRVGCGRQVGVVGTVTLGQTPDTRG